LAAASGTAFAQSSVTIGGTLEVAPIRATNLTSQSGAVSTAVKGSNLAQHNTWSTSVLSISGVEDLGGGLKASAVMISGVGDGFAARERTLGLSGGFGALRFGRFVPAAAAGFHAFTQTGSATLVGSAYGMSTSSTGAVNTTTHNALHDGGAMFERQDNVLQYTSPSFSGVTVNVAMVNNTSDSSATTAAGKTEGKQTSLHLGYAAGPLSAGIGINSRSDTTEGPTAAAVGKTDTDLQWIGVSYNLGMATLGFANVTREAKSSIGTGAATTDTDASINAFGVTVPMGAFTLRASTYSGSDKRGAGAADNVKLSGNQISAVYALSKRTAIVAATGTNQIKRDGAASTEDTRKISGTTLTVNHTF
jgi:general bacterial porin, GBP family